MRTSILILFVSLALSASASAQAERPADQFVKEREELEKLTLENRIEAAKREKGLGAQKEDLALKYALMIEKLKADLAAMEVEGKRLETKLKLEEEALKTELAEIRKERERLAAENALSVEREKKSFAPLSEKKERAQLELDLKLIELRDKLALLQAANNLKTEELRAHSLKSQQERDEIDNELKRLSLEATKLKIESERRQEDIAKLRADIELREKRHEWKEESNSQPETPAEPFQSGRLTISDRRIPLNGPIYRGVADRITSRIHYYNNISSAPIFIVIDESPGGSVMEGYRIVKAIEASRAPVHVVVKSFAGSMAAIITTLADRSYAYPNAVIHHHQMSLMTWGNMTQLKEQLEMAQKWEARLFAPLAKKLGTTPEALRKKMYEKNSDGEWQEFGDDAKNIKWVAEVVHEIRETGIVKNPDSEQTAGKGAFALAELTDEQGRPFVRLPRLEPFDMYFIHNPDRYYR